MAPAYLIITIIYGVIWIILFFLRKDLREKQLLGSFFAAPLGISEIYFLGEYWSPYFPVIKLTENVFLESILFSFFLGGVVAILYQVVFKERYFKFRRINPLISFVAPLLFITYYFRPIQMNVMHYVIASMLIGSFVIMLCLGKKTFKQILLAGLINTILY